MVGPIRCRRRAQGRSQQGNKEKHRFGTIPQLAKYLTHEHKDLSELFFKMVACVECACNLSGWEMETGGSLTNYPIL